jgi:hypothetical protein
MSDIAPKQPHDAESADPPTVERRKTDRRATVVDRRVGADRRDETTTNSTFDRRRGPGRRRTDYRRDAEEGHMNEEQLEFIKAMDEYKRVNSRPFPTWTEVLDVMLFLGYRKVAPLGEFKLSKGRQTPLREPRRSANEPEESDEIAASD